jgi:subtilisin
MKRKLYILHTILTAIIFFSFIGSAIGGEKSVIIRFRQHPGPPEEALIHKAKGTIKHTHKLIPAVTANLPEEAIAEISKNPDVAYIAENNIVTAVEPLPGDEYLNSWGVQHIGAGVVHTSGNKGAGVKIAVLDTGIDYTHADLFGNYKGGDNFVEYGTPPVDPHDPFDDSWNGHGTHISGIIAAEQNDNGVVGVAPEAELYAVKILDGGGFGLAEWVIDGIEWAVSNGMQIVNLSFEGGYNPAIEEACDVAYANGVLLIAAAGNTYGGPVEYPAGYDSVIAVTGTDVNDINAWFSPVDPKIELSAPGVNIMSTVPSTINITGYDNLSGTSQAAPHVAGTAALILSSGNLEDLNNDGQVNNEDVRLKLRMTAIDLGDTGFDYTYGFGLVDAAEAALPENATEYLTIIKTSKPAHDAKTVSLSSGNYQITIENNGLYMVQVKVSQDNFKGNRHKRFNTNRYYWFYRNRPQKVTFNLDVTSTYDVTFIPYGRKGASADITIKKES